MLQSFQATFTVLNIYLLYASTERLEYIGNRQLVPRISDSMCNITYHVMTCDEIPETVPENITAVLITNHIGSIDGAFRGQGWGYVERLQIRGPFTEEILDNYLKGLENVKELTLIFPMFYQFSSNAFAMTPKVTKVSLIEMNSLYTNTLLDALTQTGVLNNLTELIFNPGNVNSKPSLLFTEKQLIRLYEKPLILVNVSNSMIILENSALAIEFFMKLDILNISGCILVPIKGLSHLDFNRLDTVPFLKVIDISGLRAPYRTNVPLEINLLESVLFKSEHVYASDMSTPSVVTLSHNLTQAVFLMKTLIARRNKYQKININITLNINNSFELLDLSENLIEYLSLDSIINAVHLKTLKLSHNRLSAMEKSSDFPKMLKTFSNLEHLYMDHNNISLIPWTMFVYNTKLEVLSLADNRLTTIDFNLAPLTSLQTLDIRRNDIHLIDGRNLARLETFVHTIMLSNRSRIFQLLFQGNPLECTCESSDFISWIYNYTTYMKSNARFALYKCQYDSSTIEITKHAVDKSKFLCVRNVIISCSVIGFASVCAVVAILFWACWRARRRRRNWRIYDEFQRAFNLGISKQKRVCFVAYASDDEETVREVLLNPLGNKLQRMLDTTKNTIATGYDFRPGFPIYEEAFRVVQNSCVFLAVVSDAFCDSEYCLGEVREAYTQQKPIIVVLLGRVSVKKMSKYLLEIFRRNARASILKTDDGSCELIPGVDQISESIMSLSVKAYGRDTCI